MNDYSQIHDKHSLRLEYADFISRFPWDVYSTVTFREKRSDATYWSNKIWSMLERFDATRAFIACEPHKLDGIHYHVLSRHLPQLKTTESLWKYCFKAFGRSQIAFVRDAMPVSRYCAKYVVKENDFEFEGDASAWKFDDY